MCVDLGAVFFVGRVGTQLPVHEPDLEVNVYGGNVSTGRLLEDLSARHTYTQPTG